MMWWFVWQLWFWFAVSSLASFTLTPGMFSPSMPSHQLRGNTEHSPPVHLTSQLTSYFIVQAQECTSVLLWHQTHTQQQEPQCCHPHAEPFHLQSGENDINSALKKTFQIEIMSPSCNDTEEVLMIVPCKASQSLLLFFDKTGEWEMFPSILFLEFFFFWFQIFLYNSLTKFALIFFISMTNESLHFFIFKSFQLFFICKSVMLINSQLSMRTCFRNNFFSMT
jgi:hypothetical protein